MRLKQMTKVQKLDGADNEKTAESIKTAGKDFARDLLLLVEETAGDAKILNAITAIENGRTDDTFYPAATPG